MTVKMKTKSKGIVSWPADERPRERLIARGPHALTDAELTTILGHNLRQTHDMACDIQPWIGG